MELNVSAVEEEALIAGKFDLADTEFVDNGVYHLAVLNKFGGEGIKVRVPDVPENRLGYLHCNGI